MISVYLVFYRAAGTQSIRHLSDSLQTRLDVDQNARSHLQQDWRLPPWSTRLMMRNPRSLRIRGLRKHYVQSEDSCNADAYNHVPPTGIGDPRDARLIAITNERYKLNSKKGFARFRRFHARRSGEVCTTYA